MGPIVSLLTAEDASIPDKQDDDCPADLICSPDIECPATGANESTPDLENILVDEKHPQDVRDVTIQGLLDVAISTEDSPSAVIDMDDEESQQQQFPIKNRPMSHQTRKCETIDLNSQEAINVGIMLFERKVAEELKYAYAIPTPPIEGPVKRRIYHIGYPTWMIASAAMILLILIVAVINELVRIT